MEQEELKKLPLFAVVFLLIFFGGTGILLLLREPVPSAAGRQPVTRRAAGRAPARVEALPPLRLPPGMTAQRCPEDSWEYTGETAANFVSTRGRLSAWFQSQSWRPEKQITLDESLRPQVILTFSNGKYELTLQIWKIGTNRTGFSYRRDKKIEFEGEIIQ